MNGTAPRNGWAFAVPEDVAADDRYSLGIGPFGSSLKVSDYRDTGVPLVFVRHIRSRVFEGHDSHFVSEEKAKELRAHEVHPGDVLITKMGDPPGDVAVYSRGRPIGIITADCIKWRISPLVGLPEYFAYATRTASVQRQIADITKGVAQPKVSLARFRSVEYPVAPLPEQHRIVEAIESYFTRLDDAVATLERVQRNLKRYRASVLKAAVEGRLVPTEAELARAEGRDYEPASVLLERILAERRRQWQESGGRGTYQQPLAPDITGLPTLPEGWCWASIDQVGDVSGGLTKNAKRAAHDRIVPYLRVANVYADELRLDDVSEIGIRDSEMNKLLLKKGDLLVVEGNGSIDQIGRVAVWDGSIDGCVHQNHLIKVRFCLVSMGAWALRWLLSPGGRQGIEREASSTSGLHTLSISKVARLPIPLCPAAEQPRITSEVDRLLSIASSCSTIAQLSENRAARLRQSILKWAFEGKLADQDPSDEPASVLLERIRTETATPKASDTSSASPKRRGQRGTMTGTKHTK